jgi:hypothetical protein
MASSGRFDRSINLFPEQSFFDQRSEPCQGAL